jgi:hypothetical protein
MRIAISIPKPCHEDWNAMTPEKDARFCDSCQHSVADLTKATDAELVALFTSDAKPKCARFDPRQLERVLGEAPSSRSHALPIAAFSSLLAVAAGQEAMAQGDVHVKGKPAIDRPAPPNALRMGEPRIVAPQPADTIPCTIKMGEVAPHSIPPIVLPLIGDTVVMEQPELPRDGHLDRRPTSLYYYIDGVKVEGGADLGVPKSAIEEVQVITGGLPGTYGDTRGSGLFNIVEGKVIRGRMVEDETSEALPFGIVRLVDSQVAVVTDEEGRFVLPVPDELRDAELSLEFLYPGFATHRIVGIQAPTKEFTVPACTDTAVLRALPLTGRVVDATTGAVLRGATVTWVETDLRCCTDVNGMFGFPVETRAQHGTVTLRIEATGHAPQERPVPMERLPLCMPIALPRSTEPTESRTSKAIDMWNVPMQAQERPMFMGLVVTRKPTLWERVKSPFRR